jgi:hypothetical protein
MPRPSRCCCWQQTDTHQQRLAPGATGFAAGGLGCENLLDLIVDLLVDNGRVLAGKPLLLVTGLADVDPVLQKIGEGTIGERNSAVKFPHLGVPTLGDDAFVVEILLCLSKFKLARTDDEVRREMA